MKYRYRNHFTLIILILIFINCAHCASIKFGFTNAENIPVRISNSMDSEIIDHLKKDEKISILKIDKTPVGITKKEITFNINDKTITIPKGQEVLFSIIRKEVTIKQITKTQSIVRFDTEITIKTKDIYGKKIIIASTNDKKTEKKIKELYDNLSKYTFFYIKIKTTNGKIGWIKDVDIDYTVLSLGEKGDKLVEKKLYNEAIIQFSRALSIEPNNFLCLYARGFCYLELHKYNNAIDDFNECLKIKTTDIDIYISRGVAFMKLQQYSSAIADFNKALSINPDTNLALYNLACVYTAQSNNNKACDYLNEAIQKGFWKWDYIFNDPKLNNIRNTPCYKKIIASNQLIPQKKYLKNINIIQEGKKISIKDLQIIKLKKKPFIISFIISQNIDEEIINIDITASLQNNIFRVKNGSELERIPFFSLLTSIVHDHNKPFEYLILTDEAHHAIFYESEEYRRAELIKKLSNNKFEIGWKISEIKKLDGKVELHKIENNPFKNIYLIIFIDHNSNRILEQGEYIRFTLQFIE